ncbi:hypothetical protein C8R43DRAFT_946874 [Mycena crocata]|nr:hypothetical protein C8R43DRAFT_946874 [Mycena crocata]
MGSLKCLKMRNQLHVKSRFLLYKHLHSRSQRANTRACNLVTRNKRSIRPPEGALRSLMNGDESKVGQRRLCQEDIRAMEDAEELSKCQEKRKKQRERRRAHHEMLDAEGERNHPDDEEEWSDVEESGNGEADKGPTCNTMENRCEISWIWAARTAGRTDAGMEEGLKIEWAKAWARKLVYAQGAVAYTLGKANMFRELARRVQTTMTEVHMGRGRERRAATPDPTKDDTLAEDKAATVPNEGARDVDADSGDADADGSDTGSDVETDGDKAGDVHSDEEFF